MNELELQRLRIDLLRGAIEKVTGTPDKPEGNQTEFGRLLGYKDGAFVRQMLAGGKAVTEKTIRKIESLPSMEGWFTSRELIAGAPTHNEHTSDGSDAPKRGTANDLIKELLPEGKGNVLTWERPEDLEHDENRVWIDRYDYRFSAGSGVIQWEVRQKKALPFDIGYFKALGAKPKDCRLLTVHGDSMEPYLFNRDMMMIDITRTHIRDGHVYAIYFEDEPLVKQIFKEVGGGIRLHSYNSKYPDRDVHAESMDLVKIVGEVIHRSGSGLAGGN
jgi:phage repressor protein C with HTH and peptisase S24 domain